MDRGVTLDIQKKKKITLKGRNQSSNDVKHFSNTASEASTQTTNIDSALPNKFIDACDALKKINGIWSNTLTNRIALHPLLDVGNFTQAAKFKVYDMITKQFPSG